MADSLVDRFRQGDRLALSRLLTRAAHGEDLDDIARRLPAPDPAARVVAVTGSGGVGKSTLIGKLIEHLREQGLRVAVLACDPESPLTGGALLGDRFRMPSRPDDTDVFIRSLAAPSGQGAVARHLPVMARLLESFGFNVILIETVGAGQGDTAVRELADVVVLLVQPETGDDLQWEKAGLLEVADILVVHKSDLPGAAQAVAQLRAAAELSAHPVPVVQASARTSAGIEPLWQAIQKCPTHSLESGNGRALLRLAQEALATRYRELTAAGSDELRRVAEQWRQGRLSPNAAAAALLALLNRGQGSGDSAGTP
jgi:LAO/AO transport system ATPase